MRKTPPVAGPARLNKLVVALAILALGIPATARAEIYRVETAEDAIPAPPKSLREAIEKSQLNGERDTIIVPNSLGTIALVAPLPALGESPGVTVFCEFIVDIFPPEVILDGQGHVEGAFTITGPDNALVGLAFHGFAGPDVVLVGGGPAHRTQIEACRFKHFAGSISPVTAIRVTNSPSSPVMPRATSILRSVFDGYFQAVVAESAVPPSSVPAWDERTRIAGNHFSLDDFGGSGAGNERAITVDRAGPVEVLDNVVGSTLAWAARLRRSPGSSVHNNRLGIEIPSGLSCAGSAGPGLIITGSTDVTVADNEILCSDFGILVEPGSERSVVRRNTLGGRAPGTGHAQDGIAIGSVGGVLVRDNTILGSGGAGIRVFADPPGVTGSVLSCNLISGQPGPAIVKASGSVTPPMLANPSPTQVSAALNSPVIGGVEIFGGEGEDNSLYLGATTTDSMVSQIVHRLPVTNLRVRMTSAVDATEITFDGVYPSNLIGTATDRTGHETSGTSVPLPGVANGLLFDVIRGTVSNLSRSATGGVDLGPVDCLASLIAPEAQPVLDLDPPPSPGQSFFYLTRRRTADGNVAGTYDPAMCLLDLGKVFTGPRVAGAGDCQP